MTGLSIKSKLSSLLARTPLQYIPVRVRRGLAKGARWTLLPFSHNWREGGESDIEVAFELLKQPLGAVCWDFGAHFGIHTVGMARQVGENGEVVAFEPDPVAFRRLVQHVEMNGLTNVKMFNSAVSNARSLTEMVVSEGLGSARTHFRYEDEPVDASTVRLSVATVVADELVASGRIRPPDFIKIDVQGHGGKALQGSRRSVEQTLPVIFFSGHSPWERDETRAVLEPLGYVPRDSQMRTVSWEETTNANAILSVNRAA